MNNILTDHVEQLQILNMPYINSVETAIPDYEYQQSEIADFMSLTLPLTNEEKTKLKLLYHRSSIKKRYSVLPDYKIENYSPFLFKAGFQMSASLEEKMDFYINNAPRLAANAAIKSLYQDESSTITHLITVSCTGLSAPGLEHNLMQLLGLKSNTSRLAVNFVGCYAAFHALKMANDICLAQAKAKVLIVCVELCSIHFQEEITVDNLVANSLFADGAAACIVSNRKLGIKIDKFYTQVYHNGQTDMAWGISSKGFLMKLSAYIPSLIENAILPLLCEALEDANLTKSDIVHYAIHPGGRKILEAVQNSLELKNEQLKHSYNVLENYGNMSSPTILFVLKELIESKPLDGKVFAAGFGPGLTLETAFLELEPS